MKNFFSKIFTKRVLITYCIELAVAGLLVLADLLTKIYIWGGIESSGDDISLIEGVISFVAVKNTGAAFGILENSTRALGFVSLVASIVLGLALPVVASNKPKQLLNVSLVLILAGAVGNLYDRLALEYVRDFIYFELIDFAVFNVADSCLVVGTIFLLIYVIFFYRPVEKPKNTSSGVEND
ncbi:MAG: signal peptidase II [Christensenellaceae bacterium]|nr:signal peptidase II [Christensenellaceae bacterium]